MRSIPRRVFVLVLAGLAGAIVSPVAAASTPAPPAATRPAVAIVVDASPFASASEAAVGEARVDWMDRDPSDDTACTESFAGFELRDWWARAAHVDSTTIPILASREPRPDVSTIVFVGRAAAAFARDSLAGTALPPLANSPDAFRIATIERGGLRFVLVEGRSRTGTLYGTYDLIERLGVRFYGPDPGATIVPASPTPLARDLAGSSAPAFAVRGFWAWEPRGDRAFWLWMARRRMNQWTAAENEPDLLHKLGMTLTIGGHDLQEQFLDPARLATSHPDWFGTHPAGTGAAGAAVQGRNFCTTHPDARSAFVGGIRAEWLAGSWRKADEVVVWMADAGSWCTCPRCQAAGQPTERLLNLASAIADALVAAADSAGRRAPTVRTLAFLETIPAPSPGFDPAILSSALDVTFYPMDRCYAHALADSACRQANGPYVNVLRGWCAFKERGMKGELGIGEYYNIDRNKGLPFVPTAVMTRDLRFVNELGVRRLTTMHAPTRLWGPWEWTHLELATLLWNPATDVAALRAEYASRSFPSASAQVSAALDSLEFASSGMKQLLHRVITPSGPFELRKQIRLGLAPTPPDPLGWSDDLPLGPRSPGLVARLAAAHQARRSLATAHTRAARSPEERARIARYVDATDYLVDLLAFYDVFLRADALALAGDRVAARRELAGLDPIAARLRRVVDLVRTGSSHSNARDGLEATGLKADWDRLRQSLAAGRAAP